MSPLISRALGGLRAAGWQVELERSPRQLPQAVAGRYRNLDPLFVEFATTVRSCVRGDEGFWLLTAGDYAGPPQPDAIPWDEFETMLLEPDRGISATEIEAVRGFWQRHLVIAQGVTGDYEYCALDTTSGAIVHGFVVDFDSHRRIAQDFADLLAQFERVGHRSPTKALLHSEAIADLVHPAFVDDGTVPPRTSMIEKLRRFWRERPRA